MIQFKDIGFSLIGTVNFIIPIILQILNSILCESTNYNIGIF